MNWTLRPATPQDAVPLSALTRHVFADTYGAAIPPNTLDAFLACEHNPEATTRQINAAWACDVVEWQAEIIGVCKLDHTVPHHAIEQRPAIELSRLYIHPRFHGTGVAQALLNHTFSVAQQRAQRAIWLCVWEQNLRAVAFYRKNGFMPVGNQAIYVDHVKFEDWVMVKAL